ncbi:glycosyltransferase [bacterium]|nr:glycosyltransferase [Akkermansiaceae bacterium]MDB4272090.1 glycosyltransferase [bacterium]MDB4299341.1 glycosyltransferase [bacterium]MDB4311147.1 glycosyltransferase [bacterium]MDB4313390.1 glycosyltransferase [bacterium]
MGLDDKTIDFTIVSPSYNYASYIEQMLESVAGQEGVTFEHLIFDAGSTDGTLDIIRKFPHVRLVVEPDKGMSDAINKGFQAARGKWVMWLNTDDKLKPGALRQVKKFADIQPDADVIYGAWNFVDDKGGFMRRMTVFPFDQRMLIHLGCYIGSTACFYRRETTIKQGHLLNESFHYCMDGEYYARLAKHGMRFSYLPVVLADFRLHNESISQSNLEAEDIHGVLKQQIQFAEPRTIRRIYGTTLSKNDPLNGGVDCVLLYYYRLKKGLKRILYGWKVKESDE